MTADGVRKHDAFISYHSASSRRVAVFLQQQLERVARRSAGDSALRLFRDQTALTYSDLGEALQRELRGSHRFLLVLHRSTRDSRWVDEEVRYWLDHGGAPSRLILARADPDLDLSWDVERQAFCREDLLPASLRGLYRSEPLWIDISGRRLGRPHADHGELARLCATLLDEDPALVLQREVQEQRTRQRRLGGALVGVSMLLVLAVVASVLAVLNSREARRQTVEAEAQSQAAEALRVE